MGRDFLSTLLLFLAFIVFAAWMTYWGGYVPFALFWIAVGVLGSALIAYLFYRGPTRER